MPHTDARRDRDDRRGQVQYTAYSGCDKQISDVLSFVLRHGQDRAFYPETPHHLRNVLQWLDFHAIDLIRESGGIGVEYADDVEPMMPESLYESHIIRQVCSAHPYDALYLVEMQHLS